jgi:hypothetical protein
LFIVFGFVFVVVVVVIVNIVYSESFLRLNNHRRAKSWELMESISLLLVGIVGVGGSDGADDLSVGCSTGGPVLRGMRIPNAAPISRLATRVSRCGLMAS